MDTLEIEHLTRDDEAIKKCFKIIKGRSIVALEDIKVIFPTRFINRQLAVIDTVVKVMGIYAIVYEDKYAIYNKLASHTLTPYNVTDSVLDTETADIAYKVLHFRKGEVYMPDIEVMKTNTLIYNVFDELFTKGNIPWYMGYHDVANVLSSAKEQTGSGIGDNPINLEVLTALIARSRTDKSIPYRHTVDKQKDKPAFIGLNSIYYAFDNTGSKLIGGYFGPGVVTAITTPEKETSKVAKALLS